MPEHRQDDGGREPVVADSHEVDVGRDEAAGTCSASCSQPFDCQKSNISRVMYSEVNRLMTSPTVRLMAKPLS